MKARTKDEQFIVRAYETVTKLNDKDAILDRYEIGRMAGLAPKAVDTICNLLAQANFIKKLGQVEIRLTPNGEALALRVLSDSD